MLHKKQELGSVFMSIGQSGRIVIEIEPELKRKLYSILTMEGRTMKDWFITQVETLVSEENKSSKNIVDE